MTLRDSMAEQHDCGGDAAAYVLGALDRDEAEAFERHMAGCIVCRDEVATLAQVADALPMAAPQYQVPRALRRRVMQGVRAEPRGVPADAGRRSPRRAQLTVRRPALALGMAVVLALAVIGGVLLGSGGSSGTQVFRASVGDAEVRVSGAHGELIVNRLAAPPPGRIYEVWLKRAGHAPSPTATLFSVTSRGRGDIGLPGSMHGIGAVLVTAEPAGGSQAPTRPPVIIAPLSRSA
jgi:anti-sigma factor RsiW